VEAVARWVAGNMEEIQLHLAINRECGLVKDDQRMNTGIRVHHHRVFGLETAIPRVLPQDPFHHPPAKAGCCTALGG
jgi:hypothetical protein